MIQENLHLRKSGKVGPICRDGGGKEIVEVSDSP